MNGSGLGVVVGEITTLLNAQSGLLAQLFVTGGLLTITDKVLDAVSQALLNNTLMYTARYEHYYAVNRNCIW